MKTVLFDLKTDVHKKYPTNGVEMQSLSTYLTMAEKCIHKYAPDHLKDEMQRSEDAINFVADKIMRADWKYNKNKGAKKGTWRVSCAKWAIGEYNRRTTMARSPDISLSKHDEENDTSLAGAIIDKNQLEPYQYMEKIEERKECIHYLQILLTQVTELQRICVLLHEMHDFAVSEIAEAMGVHEHTVRGHIDRGMVNLRMMAGVSP